MLITRRICVMTLDFNLLWIIVFIESFDNHYYDEADIEIGKPIDCKVVVNHTVELTEEEKAEARREAIKRAEEEAYNRMTKRKTAPKKENGNNEQMALLF